MIHSPFAAAFAPGARFASERDGEVVMRTHLVGELAVPTGHLVVADPFTTDFEQPGCALARPAPIGVFPVELAIARLDNRDERVACARIRFAATPAVRWEGAAFAGDPLGPDDEPPGYGVDAGMGCFADAAACGDVDEATANGWLAAVDARRVDTWCWHVAALGDANVVMFSSGWGDGFYASYWGLDADGRVVELVTDFQVLLEPVRERIELPLPLPRGKLVHPRLAAHRITLRRPLFARNAAIVGGDGHAQLELSDLSPMTIRPTLGGQRWSWQRPAPGARLYACVMVGLQPCAPLPADE